MDYTRSMQKVLVDGIKFHPDGDDCWVLVLPEKERPYCAILADAPTDERAIQLSEKFAGLVQQWRDEGE
jgi:phosphomannomutase